MCRNSRASASRAQNRIELTERDRTLLVDLYQHGLMTRAHLQALYFGSLTRANTRLRQLMDHRYVRRIVRDEAGFGSQAIYGAGSASLPTIAELTGYDPGAMRQCLKRGTSQFIDHTLKIVDVRLSLTESLRGQTDFLLDSWMPEMLCRHAYEYRKPGSNAWNQAVFKPDAYIRFCREQRAIHCFVEVDLGHTSSTAFLRKFEQYRRYRESGLFAQRYGGESFSVLTVTTGTGRRGNLLHLAREVGMKGFLATTFTDLASAEPLALVFVTPAHATPITLREALR